MIDRALDGGCHGINKARMAVMLFVLLLSAGFGGAQAIEGPAVQTDNAQSRLAIGWQSVAPGQQIHIAFAQKLAPGWHVYWRNPGDSGLPLKLDFKNPDGLAADAPEGGLEIGEIIYPVPHALPLPPLMNYGHEGEPIFLVPVTVPLSAIPGEVLVFDIAAQWLICADICVPETADLSLTVPVEAAPGARDPVWAGRIKEALAAAPEPLLDGVGVALLSISDRDGDAPVLFIPARDIFGISPGTAAMQRKIDNGDYYFFPYREGLIEPAAMQVFSASSEGMRVTFTAGYNYDPEENSDLEGVLVDRSFDPHRGIIIRTQSREKSKSAGGATFVAESNEQGAQEQSGGLATTAEKTGSAEKTGAGAGAAGGAGSALFLPRVRGDQPAGDGLQTLPMILLFSLIGGLILNIMPCVFPVIFMKAAGLAALGPDARGEIRLHGLIYTLGVVICFAALAAILIMLKAGGEEVGWGFHLQSPIMVSFFTLVIFLIGLNFMGLFEIGTSLQGIGSGLATKPGAGGAFFTGLLAVAVAAPCIGPFLGVPIGYAFTQPAGITLLIFIVMGIGLAMPYLMLSLFPWLARVLPQPGFWMIRFRQILSFAMFGTCIWLIWTLTLQAGPSGLVQLLSALLLAGFAAWLFGLSQESGGAPVKKLIALAAFAGAILGIIRIEQAPPAAAAFEDGRIVAYSEEKLSQLRAEGRAVFIDFTAAWCVTCQVNKRTVLSTEAVKEAFADNDVTLMIADWTVQDPAITRALEAMGRSGVPLYLYYAPGAATPDVLPQILTVSMVLAAISP